MAQVLRPINNIFDHKDYPNVLVGLQEPDDAAVFQVDGNRAIISTTDFFPPVVDSPYDFGAIAAANALSDVYAMGGVPLMAINLVAFPDGLDISILTEILRGGAEKVREAGAVITGGHTITDKEPKYGLSVTGEVEINKLIKKSGAQVGDKLILSKPLGIGVITTALKQNKISLDNAGDSISIMSRLNRVASELAVKHRVNAMTDITGYSLVGHAHEMAHLSQVKLRIVFDNLNWVEGALELAQEDVFPGGMGRNLDYFSRWTPNINTLAEHQQGLLFDPQTSGGLLMAVDRERANLLLEDLLSHGEEASIVGDVADGVGEIEFLT